MLIRINEIVHLQRCRHLQLWTPCYQFLSQIHLGGRGGWENTVVTWNQPLEKETTFFIFFSVHCGVRAFHFLSILTWYDHYIHSIMPRYPVPIFVKYPKTEMVLYIIDAVSTLLSLCRVRHSQSFCGKWSLTVIKLALKTRHSQICSFRPCSKTSPIWCKKNNKQQTKQKTQPLLPWPSQNLMIVQINSFYNRMCFALE